MKILSQDGNEIVNAENVRNFRLDHWMNFELREEEQRSDLGTCEYVKSTITADPVREHENEDGYDGIGGISLGWYYSEKQAECAFSALWDAILSGKDFLEMSTVYKGASKK